MHKSNLSPSMATLGSTTSEGAFPDHQDVGPTGGTGEPGASFWDAMLKPRGANSPRNDGNSKKPATSNMLGWLAGFGSGGRSSSGVGKNPRPCSGGSTLQADDACHQSGSSSSSSSSHGEMPNPTGGRENEATDGQASSPSAGAMPRKVGVPRLNSGERGPTGRLLEMTTMPITTTMLLPSGVPPAQRQPLPPVRAASAGSAMDGSLGSPLPRLASPPEPPPSASPGLRCKECHTPIQGAVFMLQDQSYCCQRHRLVAYHKNEKEGKGGETARFAPAAPLSPNIPHATGLRASFSTWI